MIDCTVALGKTDDRINLASLGQLHLTTVEKTLFSMATPEVLSLLQKHKFKSLVLMGIEVRCAASEHHQYISTSVVACLCAAVHP